VFEKPEICSNFVLKMLRASSHEHIPGVCLNGAGQVDIVGAAKSRPCKRLEIPPA
jgi:hypothetical protein